MSTFYGAIVKPGKPTAFVPPGEGSLHLHLSQATLSASVPEGKRVSLQLKMEDQEVGWAIGVAHCHYHNCCTSWKY